MNTPIADFCKEYAKQNTSRFHMPGHKGKGPLGVEELDMTEIKGADSLYEADGIIAESEANAAKLFGTRQTFYSAGGSSQSIKAMCLLACRLWEQSERKKSAERPLILAGRNAHKSFVQASQLIGFDIEWMASEEEEFSLCKCTITPEGLEMHLERLQAQYTLTTNLNCGTKESPRTVQFHPMGNPLAAVYVTSPDYLGNVLDIQGLAEVAHRFGLPLLVDNAHGAYLKFLPEDQHPITLGADACADSAHKTLPVLTGGGYLHIGAGAPEGFEESARDAMCLFGSTSPSYLILQSLDLCNDWLDKHGAKQFKKTKERVEALKEVLQEEGLTLIGNEPLKLTIDCTASGTDSGLVYADRLRDFGIEPEYADRDVVVLMFAPHNKMEEYENVATAVHMLQQARRIQKQYAGASCSRKTSEHAGEDSLQNSLTSFTGRLPTRVLQPYEVLLRNTETIPVKDAEGRVAADVHIGCPPAVLPVVPGERVDANAIAIMKYYGIQTLIVLK